MMKFYSLYGQIVQSEIELPEADEITPEALQNASLSPTASIFLAPPPEWVLESCSEENFEYLTEQVMWFYLPGLVLFYVENGDTIKIWQESSELPQPALRSYLLGSAFTLLLMQKGILPIHGSALSLNGTGIIISGCSGSGKSTTAQALQRNGYQFVADDISAVQIQDNKPVILPGPPWQKVCRDVMERASNPQDYIYIDEDRDKFAIRLTSDYAQHSIPASCMIIIEVSQKENVELTEITGVEKLHYLTHNLYRGEVYNKFGVSPARMQLFLNTITHLHIFVLRRPQHANSVDTCIDMINAKLLQIC